MNWMVSPSPPAWSMIVTSVGRFAIPRGLGRGGSPCTPAFVLGSSFQVAFRADRRGFGAALLGRAPETTCEYFERLS